MSITNDRSFIQAVLSIELIQPRSLWEHLNNIACYLALIGAKHEAFDVWKLAYSGDIPVPNFRLKSVHCCAAMFCHIGNFADLTAQYRSDKDTPLLPWLSRMEIAAYHMLLTYKYAMAAEFTALATLRDGLSKATPEKGQRSSASELDALSSFDEFIQDPQKFVRSLIEIHLIYADISFRHGMHDEAIKHLLAWNAMLAYINADLRSVLSLKSTATLAFNGVLANTSAIPIGKRRATINTMIAQITEKLDAPPAKFDYPTELKISIFYNSLCFGPADEEIYEPEWDFDMLTGDAAPAYAPIASYPRIISIGLESGYAQISIRIPSIVPNEPIADDLIVFPLKVLSDPGDGTLDGRRGTVFPSSPTLPIDDVGFNITPGEYDVLARLNSTEETNTALLNWTIVLSFFPRGSFPQLGIQRVE